MYLIEEALKRVVGEGQSVLIPCTDAKNQESVRAMVFHLKRKLLPEFTADTVGITKFNYEGQFFIKVYPRGIAELYELNSEGVPVAIERPSSDDAETQRIVELMRKDGKSDEEIQKFIEEQGEQNEQD